MTRVLLALYGDTNIAHVEKGERGRKKRRKKKKLGGERSLAAATIFLVGFQTQTNKCPNIGTSSIGIRI